MKRINKIRVNNFAGMIKMIDPGETLIKKCQRILDEGEPLTDGAPMIYTPKQAGVRRFKQVHWWNDQKELTILENPGEFQNTPEWSESNEKLVCVLEGSYVP